MDDATTQALHAPQPRPAGAPIGAVYPHATSLKRWATIPLSSGAVYPVPPQDASPLPRCSNLRTPGQWRPRETS